MRSGREEVEADYDVLRAVVSRILARS